MIDDITGTIEKAMKTLLIIGITTVAVSYLFPKACKPNVDPNIFSKLERLSNGLEVKVASDRSGRKVVIYDPNDKNRPFRKVNAVDTDRDGRFDEIYINVEKGDKIEKYVSLDQLEQLYSHAVQYGTDERGAQN